MQFKYISLGMPATLLTQLSKYCARTGVLRAEFIRRAIADALRKVEGRK